MTLPRFTAIPVGQGDAFYLEYPHKTILVDGGIADSFPPFEYRHLKSPLDIVVCTHNDADHAKGIIGLLEANYPCKEIWLPGNWTYRLEDLLKNPYDFLKEIFESCNQLERKQNLLHLDEIGDHYSQRRWSVGEELQEDWSGDESSLDEAIEHGSDELSGFFLNKYIPIFLNPLPGSLEAIFYEALEAASRIRRIAMLAYHSGATIRWFEYGLPSTEGIKNVLEPVNAKEILQIRSRKITALNYVALSTANRESLVMYAPSSEGAPPVLFTADSDLSFLDNNNKFQLRNYEEGTLITAPHHGSETNKKAYDHLAKAGWLTTKTVLVRSDGKFKSRPGQSFLNQPQHLRYCTTCRGSAGKQAVVLKGNSNWIALSGTKHCNCK